MHESELATVSLSCLFFIMVSISVQLRIWLILSVLGFAILLVRVVDPIFAGSGFDRHDIIGIISAAIIFACAFGNYMRIKKQCGAR